MAKGNSGGLGDIGMGMNSSSQYRPEGLKSRKPGANLTGGGGMGGNDLLGSLQKILGDPSIQNEALDGSIRNFSQLYGGQGGGGMGNLFQGNAYSQMPSGFQNPYMQYNPYGNPGRQTPLPQEMPIPRMPKGPTQIDDGGVGIPVPRDLDPIGATGNDSLGYINSKLTRGLEADEISQLGGAIGYKGDGALNQGQINQIMELIKQNNPKLLRGTGV